MASILLITPDSALEGYVSQMLGGSAHQLTVAHSAGEAARTTFTIPVDLILADSLSPGLDDARARIETAQAHASFAFIAGPNARLLPGRLPTRNSDTVLQRPPAASELQAAIAASIGRSATTVQEIPLGDLTLDRTGQRVASKDDAVSLTPIEFRLIDHLASARGGIVSTDDLLEHVWAYSRGTGSSEVVRSHLKNLRSKLRRLAGGGDLIQTVPRRGYRINAA
jgi:DNA-binding response OmpR family regulator